MTSCEHTLLETGVNLTMLKERQREQVRASSRKAWLYLDSTCSTVTGQNGT